MSLLFVQWIKRQVLQSKKDLVKLQEELSNNYHYLSQSYKEIEDSKILTEKLNNEVYRLEKEKDSLIKQSANISIMIEDKKHYLRTDLAEIEQLQNTQRNQLQSNLAELEKAERNKLDLILSNAKIECDEKLNKILEATELEISNCENQAIAARKKYLSVIEVLNRVEETSADPRSQIEVSNSDKADIEFLLNNVVERLRNPDVLYKLIWTEYIQKPTNQMLDYILPSKDCSGIYKITNIIDGKCYIGRSTSVRKRLTDHIKSTIGISTIADQYVHQVMRKDNLWNFRFELIEECEKSELGSREKYYIDFFNSNNQKYGYNAVGGSEYKE